MDELLNDVNASSEVNVEPQNNEVINNAPDTGASENNSAAAEQKPVQSPEQNAAFARIRREAEQRARDSAVSELSNGQFTSWADYQAAVEAQKAADEAAKVGVDPAFYQEFNTVKSKLSSLEREKTLLEQDSRLASDPAIGELYKQWKTDVQQLANSANVDYDTAFTIVARNKLPELLSKSVQKGEQEAVKKLITNAQSSPGAVGDGGNAGKTPISKMSKADFDKLQESALRGEIKQF